LFSRVIVMRARALSIVLRIFAIVSRLTHDPLAHVKHKSPCFLDVCARACTTCASRQSRLSRHL
jgi:hypothetical protein